MNWMECPRQMIEQVLFKMVKDAKNNNSDIVAEKLYIIDAPGYGIRSTATFDIPLEFICRTRPWSECPIQSRPLPSGDQINLIITQTKLWVWVNNLSMAVQSGIIIADTYDIAAETLKHMHVDYTFMYNFAILLYGDDGDDARYVPSITKSNDYDKLTNNALLLQAKFGSHMWFMFNDEGKEKEEMGKNKKAINKDNSLLLRVFNVSKDGDAGSIITAFDINAVNYRINLQRWMDLKNYNLRDVSQILDETISYVGSDDHVRDLKIGDMYIWYYEDSFHSMDYGIIIASNMDEAVNIMYTPWICESAGFPTLPIYAKEKSISIYALKDVYNTYIWWRLHQGISNKSEPDNIRNNMITTKNEINAITLEGEHFKISINPDGSTEPPTDMTKVWMYVLYPATSFDNVGFVIGEDVEEAWKVISNNDLYIKAGGEWIGISNTSYCTPAHYMVLINLGTKQRFGNFGDKFMPVHDKSELEKSTNDDIVNTNEKEIELLALYRWYILKDEGATVKVGVAIFDSYNPDGLIKLLQTKYPNDTTVEYKVKELLKLPGFTGVESMICDLIEYDHKVHFDD